MLIYLGWSAIQRTLTQGSTRMLWYVKFSDNRDNSCCNNRRNHGEMEHAVNWVFHRPLNHVFQSNEFLLKWVSHICRLCFLTARLCCRPTTSLAHRNNCFCVWCASATSASKVQRGGEGTRERDIGFMCHSQQGRDQGVNAITCELWGEALPVR